MVHVYSLHGGHVPLVAIILSLAVGMTPEVSPEPNGSSFAEQGSLPRGNLRATIEKTAQSVWGKLRGFYSDHKLLDKLNKGQLLLEAMAKPVDAPESQDYDPLPNVGPRHRPEVSVDGILGDLVRESKDADEMENVVKKDEGKALLSAAMFRTDPRNLLEQAMVKHKKEIAFLQQMQAKFDSDLISKPIVEDPVFTLQNGIPKSSSFILPPNGRPEAHFVDFDDHTPLPSGVKSFDDGPGDSSVSKGKIIPVASYHAHELPNETADKTASEAYDFQEPNTLEADDFQGPKTLETYVSQEPKTLEAYVSQEPKTLQEYDSQEPKTLEAYDTLEPRT